MWHITDRDLDCLDEARTQADLAAAELDAEMDAFKAQLRAQGSEVHGEDAGGGEDEAPW